MDEEITLTASDEDVSEVPEVPASTAARRRRGMPAAYGSLDDDPDVQRLDLVVQARSKKKNQSKRPGPASKTLKTVPVVPDLRVLLNRKRSTKGDVKCGALGVQVESWHGVREVVAEGVQPRDEQQHQLVSSSDPRERRDSWSSSSSIEVLDFVRSPPPVIDLSSDSEGPATGSVARFRHEKESETSEEDDSEEFETFEEIGSSEGEEVECKCDPVVEAEQATEQVGVAASEHHAAEHQAADQASAAARPRLTEWTPSRARDTDVSTVLVETASCDWLGSSFADATTVLVQASSSVVEAASHSKDPEVGGDTSTTGLASHPKDPGVLEENNATVTQAAPPAEQDHVVEEADTSKTGIASPAPKDPEVVQEKNAVVTEAASPAKVGEDTSPTGDASTAKDPVVGEETTPKGVANPRDPGVVEDAAPTEVPSKDPAIAAACDSAAKMGTTTDQTVLQLTVKTTLPPMGDVTISSSSPGTPLTTSTPSKFAVAQTVSSTSKPVFWRPWESPCRSTANTATLTEATAAHRNAMLETKRALKEARKSSSRDIGKRSKTSKESKKRNKSAASKMIKEEFTSKMIELVRLKTERPMPASRKRALALSVAGPSSETVGPDPAAAPATDPVSPKRRHACSLAPKSRLPAARSTSSSPCVASSRPPSRPALLPIPPTAQRPSPWQHAPETPPPPSPSRPPASIHTTKTPPRPFSLTACRTSAGPDPAVAPAADPVSPKRWLPFSTAPGSGLPAARSSSRPALLPTPPTARWLSPWQHAPETPPPPSPSRPPASIHTTKTPPRPFRSPRTSQAPSSSGAGQTGSLAGSRKRRRRDAVQERKWINPWATEAPSACNPGLAPLNPSLGLPLAIPPLALSVFQDGCATNFFNANASSQK